MKDVAGKSGRSINISLFTDGTLGSASDNYSSVASGDLDMTMTGLEGLDLYAPEYTFLDCPFLIKDEAHLKSLLESGIGDNLKERYEENGFVTLGWHYRNVIIPEPLSPRSGSFSTLCGKDCGCQHFLGFPNRPVIGKGAAAHGTLLFHAVINLYPESRKNHELCYRCF